MISMGTPEGSMRWEAPSGKPRAPSSCGGGNFSLLLFAFPWEIILLGFRTSKKFPEKLEAKQSSNKHQCCGYNALKADKKNIHQQSVDALDWLLEQQDKL
ncbi:hypothetical protein SAY86_025040 [Trapa natans]|uniref:Uncharacterized protein n=1 Tax=Trapa natans TaxID=22666 RepID=A0AAN7MQE3_TRANT|nr:hypothetical protein SAY86_025040 [Trapa natans]